MFSRQSWHYCSNFSIFLSLLTHFRLLQVIRPTLYNKDPHHNTIYKIKWLIVNIPHCEIVIVQLPWRDHYFFTNSQVIIIIYVYQFYFLLHHAVSNLISPNEISQFIISDTRCIDAYVNKCFWQIMLIRLLNGACLVLGRVEVCKKGWTYFLKQRLHDYFNTEKLLAAIWLLSSFFRAIQLVFIAIVVFPAVKATITALNAQVCTI